MLLRLGIAPTTIGLVASVSFTTASPPRWEPSRWRHKGHNEPASHPGNSTAVNTTICNGQRYVYEELAGYGYLPADGVDETGDTLGGLGSDIAIDRTSWRRHGDHYKGLMYALPDRGWNTNGTLNYQNRIHKIEITFTPQPNATVEDPASTNIIMDYLDTILLTDPSGMPTSGLDANVRGPYLTFPGIPFPLPSVNFTGNGFGGNGTGGSRVVIDSEGLVLGKDGTFWISDEYGDYTYHFSPNGTMIGAIRPPNAFIPRRNNATSFSADSPPIYAPSLSPNPSDTSSGRDNNHGAEGLTTNPENTKLYILMQSALAQEGGLHNPSSRNTRFLIYDISNADVQPVYEAEYIVPLPLYRDADNETAVARQSEIHYISPTQFLILPRDSDAGAGFEHTSSKYRHVDVFDISEATDIKGAAADCYDCAIATEEGVLLPNVTAAGYCSWLDFNVNAQLQRFGVHNGGEDDAGLLNEKWESLALVPVLGEPRGEEDEYYLFSLSDNDFITQKGFMDGGRLPYADGSGGERLNQALVFKVALPRGSRPLVG